MLLLQRQHRPARKALPHSRVFAGARRSPRSLSCRGCMRAYGSYGVRTRSSIDASIAFGDLYLGCFEPTPSQWWETNEAAVGRFYKVVLVKRRKNEEKQTTHQVGVDLDRRRPQPTVFQHAADATDSHALPQPAHDTACDHDVLHWLERITAIRRRACSWRVRSSTVRLCVRHGFAVGEDSGVSFPFPSVSMYPLLSLSRGYLRLASPPPHNLKYTLIRSRSWDDEATLRQNSNLKIAFFLFLFSGRHPSTHH